MLDAAQWVLPADGTIDSSPAMRAGVASCKAGVESFSSVGGALRARVLGQESSSSRRSSCVTRHSPLLTAAPSKLLTAPARPCWARVRRQQEDSPNNGRAERCLKIAAKRRLQPRTPSVHATAASDKLRHPSRGRPDAPSQTIIALLAQRDPAATRVWRPFLLLRPCHGRPTIPPPSAKQQTQSLLVAATSERPVCASPCSPSPS